MRAAARMSTLPAKRKCQKSHCSLVSSVASAPQFRYTMRLSGLRALCFDTASIRAAPTFDPVQCITNGMFWSVMLFSAISASAGGIFPCDDILEVFQELVATGPERTGERVGVGKLDGFLCNRRPSRR